ncbi:MAG: WcaF family extracellular polysaccharide biosynthesis acetyltransferase [Verrucomicrobia bacterium]|nr:WcaF family extracellular polysaccharide biosynthesis acetyltransferase [Verrucomicrobiota bacterium]
MHTEDNSVQSKVRLDQFDPNHGLDRGKSKLTEIVWYLFKMIFILTAFPWPQSLKHFVLRLFGARLGKGVVIKPRVNIHFPWKLTLGDHCWIGEECFILNFEPVSVGKHACLSQRSFLCGGNHNFRSPEFEYRNGPITIGDGAWVGAQVFLGPNVKLGVDCVISAGSRVFKNMPDGMICAGDPCEPKSNRWK